MTCPDLGRLRAWLDAESSPAGLADHLTTCPACADLVDDLRAAADIAAAAIGQLAAAAPPTQTPALAHQRRKLGRAVAHAAAPATAPRRPSVPPSIRSRPAWAALAAGLALAFFVATPAGQSAAAQFLAQFRSQRFTAVTVDTGRGAHPFRDLERIGTISGNRPTGRGATVASLAEASRAVGFSVKQPGPGALPSGFDRVPKIEVAPASELRFTFDRAKARAYFDQTSHRDVELPDKFDGASLVLRVPAAALLSYRGADDSPGVLVGQAGELEAAVDGQVSLDELRDFLLSLPNLPPDTARQLRQIKDWRNTLPIPVPADKVNWQETTIAGGPGLLVADTSGFGSAAIWQRDGRVYGIAGTIKPDELRRVADSLK